MDKDEDMEIDDSLYSRQRYVLGDKAMQLMARSSVFISGLGGLGVEIAKNVVLAGVKSVAIHDPSPCSLLDLSSQFFIRPEDVAAGKTRAEASLSRLAELNPYVRVSMITEAFGSDVSFLSQYQCVVLTGASLDRQLAVNKFCRSQTPPIKFICCSVVSVFSTLFCDFGPEFVVQDKDGEEPIESFVGNITKASPGVVTSLEGQMHGFSTGDLVTFREVVGMEALNGTTHTVKVLSPGAFSIGDTEGAEFGDYEHGGLARQVKTHSTITFESLEQQLRNPSILLADFAKPETPLQVHLGMLALDKFLAKHTLYPRPRNLSDAEEVIALAIATNQELKLVEEVDRILLTQLSYSAWGVLPSLATAVGGIAAQEALISLTGKFSPLQQWLFLEATELVAGSEKLDSAIFLPRGDRYDSLRICLGEELLQKMANCHLFMVGCGAIGCEMLKNYAMLGVGRGPAGLITITDNDLIEKSNLNRQFLFRPKHIQQPKSVVAAQSTLDINPDLRIDAQQYKVFPGTEKKVYHDTFYQSQSVVVNALDNVEARRYVDSRCVTNLRPLLESGTMGPKGHVQVVVPHMTESYSSQQDPPDKDVPYCTLKSFPATIEHTIQWARDKFEALFFQKPSMYSKFWETHGHPTELVKLLRGHQSPDGAVKVVKMLGALPRDWRDCVRIARVKFEKYFNHKALNLLHKFPLDTKMKDGSLFWQSPKRPPVPMVFIPSNKDHVLFVATMARLLASVHGVRYTQQELNLDSVAVIISSTQVPTFQPSAKTVVTDESVKKPVAESVSMDAMESCLASLEGIVAAGTTQPGDLRMCPQVFEKDDDSNGHIDFISTAANLRAEMYSIETVDRLKAKLIAGRIVPAIATTTAAVAGLVSIELVKVIKGGFPIESYKNAFLSLALPSLVFSEPAAPQRTLIAGQHSYTLWDRWEVKGHKDMQLQEFRKTFQDKYGLEPAVIVQGVKLIYVPWMPAHKKRLTQTMIQLLKPDKEKLYSDLVISFENPSGEEQLPGPPVRYYFS